MTRPPAHARDRRPRRWLWALPLVALGVPLALFAVDGYYLWRSSGELQSSADASQAAVEARDAQALSAQVVTLQAAATTFADHAEGWHWDLAALIPWVEDQTVPLQQAGRSVRVLADDALAPLASMEDLSALETVPLEDGGFDPFFLEPYRAPLAQAADALASQEVALASVDTSASIDRIADQYRTLQDSIAELGDTVHVAHVAAELLPSMLGGEGPRTYALMVQNNAEPRASGGIPGAVLEVIVDRGRITLGQYVEASAMSDPQNPVAPLTEDEERVFSIKMAQYAQNVNFTPEYPRAAEVMAAFWKRQTGEDVDGVLSIDPVAMGYMLEGMDPVEVDGIEISGSTISQVLLSDVYWAYDSPDQTDAFFALAARELFGQLLAGQTGLVDGVERAIDQRRFMAWSRDAQEQALLETVPVGARWVDQPELTGVFLNDASGSKIGYYIDQSIDVRTTLCPDGRVAGQEVTLTLTHTFDGDVDAMPDYVSGGGIYVPEGQFSTNVVFYPPANLDVLGVTIDGNPALFSRDIHHTRHVGSARATVEPGETVTITWSTRGEASGEAQGVAWTPLARNTSGEMLADVSAEAC